MEAPWAFEIHTTSPNRKILFGMTTYRHLRHPLINEQKLNDKLRKRLRQKNVKWKSYGACVRKQKQMRLSANVALRFRERKSPRGCKKKCKSSINQIPTKKMMDNEIEGVQFNRKRMNSTISNSSGGRSMDTPSKFGDQVTF